jgi:hypothetical protein
MTLVPALGLLASHRHGRGFEQFLDRAARSAEEQEREGDADPGKHGDGEEGRLEALGQGDEAVGIGVRCQVVVVRETATVVTIATPSAAPIWNAVLLRPEEPGLALGDAGKRCDRGGDEGEADAGASAAPSAVRRSTCSRRPSQVAR